MRLIDVDKLLAKFEPEIKYKCFRTDLNGIKDILADDPTVEAVPVETLEAIRDQMCESSNHVWNVRNHPDFCSGVDYCIDLISEVLEERKEADG